MRTIRRYGLPAILYLLFGVGIFSFLVLGNDWNRLGDGWPPPAHAQVTTFVPISSITRLTTLNKSTAVIPVIVPNTGTTWLTRTIILGDALSGYLTTFDASNYVTSSTLAGRNYLTTFNGSPYLLTSALPGFQYVSTSDLAARNFLTTFDASSYITSAGLNSRQYVTTSELASRGYLTTAAGGGGITTTDLAAYQYVTTSELAARGYITTSAPGSGITTFDASPYLLTAALPAFQYVSTSNLAARGYITTFDASQFVSTTALESRGYITTFNASPYLLTAALPGFQYVSTTNLAARGYINTFNASPYLLTAALPGFQYVSTTNLAARQYVSTTELAARQYVTTTELAARGYLTTYTDTVGTGAFNENASYTWGADQTFGPLTTGVKVKMLRPIETAWTDGQWAGPAIMGNVSSNVGTGAILYRSGGLWAPYSAITTGTLPTGMALNAIGTSAPGIVLLKGAMLRRDALALGTTTVVWFSGTTAGTISATVPTGTGHTIVAILLNMWSNVCQLIFGDSWGTK
jgi:hypothetical protein